MNQHDSRFFAVYLLSGIVLPIVGFFVAPVAIAATRGWTFRERLFAALGPLVVAIVVGLVVLVASIGSRDTWSTVSVAGVSLSGPPILLVTTYGALALAPLVIGVWLAARARHRKGPIEPD